MTSTDVIKHAKNKYKDVSIKLSNFIYNNKFAPISVKSKVLQSCVSSALLYSCETWSSSSIIKVECLFRDAIKNTFSVRKNIPNDIIYTEFDIPSLKAPVYKRQFKYWNKIKNDIQNDPESPISKLYSIAITANIPFIKHYQNLVNCYRDEFVCFNSLNLDAQQKRTSNFTQAYNSDPHSIAGTYYSLNPNL